MEKPLGRSFEVQSPYYQAAQCNQKKYKQATYKKGTFMKSINKEHLALILNRLNEKSARYECHKDFISYCIKNCLIPKGLKLEVEPTIGNFGQEFTDNWFQKLNDYSFDWMKDMIKFCDKTMAQTKPAIHNIEAKLTASMEREFSEVDKTSKKNKEATKCLLQQRKFKIFNHL